MRYSREWILQVRELMERHLDAIQIAHRVGLDPQDIMAMIEIIKQVVS